MKQITSRENASVKRFVSLMSDKNEREREQLIAMEGVRLCLDALQSGLALKEVYVTEKAVRKHSEIGALLDKAAESFEISESVAAKMSDAKTPQGVFVLCEKPHNKRPQSHKPDARYLLMASLQDAGNVGAIIRTAEALGIDGIAMTCDCPDLYSPKVLRASMGGVFRLPVWVVEDMREELARLQSEGVTAYAAALRADAQKLGEAAFCGKCAVLLGNEGAGLSAELIEACDGSILIPMSGQADSLSVAMAAGILVWEMKK